MGTESLRHQSSISYNENKHSGCMWGLFRFLDLQRHSHRRKMLSYRNHEQEGSRVLISEQSFAWSGQESLLNKESNVKMETKVTVVKKSSSKAHLINLLYRKLTKKRDRKLKLTASESRLLRTISIHHLECNDYALSDGLASDSESSTAELTSQQEKKISEESEQLAHSPRDSQLIIFNKQREDMVSMEGMKRDGNKTVLNRFKDFRQRFRDAFKENKKERRISMDGVIDKVPLGQKIAEDVDTEMGSRSKDGRRMKFGIERFVVYKNSKIVDKSFERSRSLTESLDRYSHLLESISVREPQRVPVRLNSIKKQDNISEQRRVLRSRSLTESFDRYSRLLETFPVREPRKQPERLKSIREGDVLFDKRPLRTFGRILSNPEIISSFSNKVENEISDAVNVNSSSDEPKPDGILVNTEEILENNASIIQEGTSDHNEPCAVSDVPEAEDSNIIHQPENEIEITEDSNNKHAKPSPVSVLDSDFEEHPVSPAKYAMTQGEEQDFLRNPAIDLVDENSNVREITDTNKTNYLHQDEEAEFNYVKDILRKSGFGGGADELLEAWYSSYEPVDRLLFVEGEDALETIKDEPSENDQLLLDLINEILLEIYENTIATTMGLSRFDPRIRTVTVGDYVFDNVWAKVSRQLVSQEYMNLTLEQVVARDFVKDEGWMKLTPDIESLGIELEGLVLEDLVNEIVEDYGGV